MAALAFGAIGAGVGSLFGAASIGWSLGSFIGGQLFGPEGQDIKGPRITDNNLMSSSYGEILPVGYGSYRTAGKVIWQTDLVEHSHKEEAGKGGGGGSYTSYTYTVSFALAILKNQITGIRKMWFDSKLVYSVADVATAAELQVSEKLAKKIRIYNGSTTQLADPTMEAALGAGNVPGYRGTAYLVFTDLEVTDYGGRIPQITVEFVQGGSFSFEGDQIVSGGASLRQSLSLRDGVAHSFYYGYSYDGTADSLGRFEERTISLIDFSEKFTNSYYAVPAGDESTGYRYLSPVSVSPKRSWHVAEVGSAGSGSNVQYLLFSSIPGSLGVVSILDIAGDLDNYKNGDDVSFNLCWEDDYNLWFYKFNSGDVYHWEIIVTPISVYIQTDSFNVDDTRQGLDPTDNYGSFCIDRSTGDVYVEIETKDAIPQYSIKRYSRDGELLETKFEGITWRSIPGRLMGFSHGVMWEVNGQDLERYDWDTETLISSGQVTSDQAFIDQAIMEVSGNLAVISAQGELYPFSPRLPRSGIALDDLVSDICTRVGLETSDLSVTALAPDTVRGFLIARQEPARASLEQLSSAYFFDGVETDGLLKFVKRGGAVASSLDDSDIGCYEGDSVEELWEATRTQEEELPLSLTLNYANVGADYQVGSQQTRRQVTLNGTEVTTQLSIAFSDDEAKDIVDTWMYSVWMNRHRFNMKTWQKYAKLDPTDVISAQGETMRIVRRDDGVNGLIELEAVRELPAIYTGQVGTGSASGHSSQSVSVPGITEYLLLDIPPLRDSDYDNYGIYWAASGLLTDWNGATLLRSPDDGNTWGVEMTNDNSAVIGQAQTALGNWTGGNVFDEKNVLRVKVTGTLESKTRLQVLNGANVAMVGDELIQFRTATLVSTGVYDLTGLLRGRMGTEWAMDEHADYEDFVLLDSSSIRFVDVPSVDFNTRRTWGVVTYGDTIEDIDTSLITYSGNNIRPLAPVHIGGGTTGANTSWVFTWTDRTRFEWQWRDSVDASEDESSSDFEVRILNGVTAVRTISVTDATTATYTNAQQVSDFGSHQREIDIQVRKIGTVNSEWSDVVSLNSGVILLPGISLLNLNGANGSTTITDVYTRTWTAAGNAQLTTTGQKYGSACLTLDGTGDYAHTVTSGFAITTTADFTVEMWVYPTSNSGIKSLFSTRKNASGSNLILRANGGVIAYGATPTSSGYTLVLNTWQHIAMVRHNGTLYLYADGVLKSSVADTSAYPADYATEPVKLGMDWDATGGWQGLIDDFRFSDIAQYTTAFAPPGSELTE